ncbi:MAG: iron-containing alcohol dehydrogenase [Spirochaetales bacterium]|nr:iron-containing alcohol dehydrogenase [Spirochaetales bacterium]
MNNFIFYNPVKIVFGKETILELKNLLPQNSKILLVYGGGSIKKNGVYNQVLQGLEGFNYIEFSGIEANPEYETCMKAVEIGRKESITFILGVGGGSVVDAVKFIAAAIPCSTQDPWKTIVRDKIVEKAIPFGAVLTLPATGSEMNNSSVISNRNLEEKFAFASDLVYPVFSILDPETTYSLPEKQVANGIVDSFVHVLEQYLTSNIDTPIQDRWAESILLTLIDLGKSIIDDKTDYNKRANLMWASTSALNGYIGVGVVQDWATHQIGHEITACYGLDHARSLAIVLPGLLSIQRKQKKEKLIQYANRVWGVTMGDPNVIIDEVITRTTLFFQSLGISGRFVDYGINPEEAAEKIGNIFISRDSLLGENRDISGEVVKKILLNRQCLY